MTKKDFIEYSGKIGCFIWIILWAISIITIYYL
jgi:hypothetical protein